MSKLLKPALLTAGLLALAGGAASAHDYDETSTRHIRQDQRALYRDAAEVREERAELYAAHRRLRWAWWHGNDWQARRAAHDVREERAELDAARRKLHAQRRDIAEDRDERYDNRPHRRWWQ